MTKRTRKRAKSLDTRSAAPEQPVTGEPAPSGAAQPRLLLEASLFFLFVFVVYVASPLVAPGDSSFVIPTALSILRHGDADVDEYKQRFAEAPWAIRQERGHSWNVYPIGVPFLSLPFVFAIDRAEALLGKDLETRVLHRPPLVEELVVASLFTAAAAALVFAIARRRLPLVSSLFLAGAFAFGTPAYSTASRALFQHGPSMMLLAAAVLIFPSVSRGRIRTALLLGVVAGLSYIVRASSLSIILAFAVLVGLTARKRLVPYLVGAALGVLPMFAFNQLAFGTWSSHYYRLLQSAVSVGPPAVKPGLAILVSPSRGLFVFSPFLLLVLARFVPRVWRRHRPDALEIALASLCFLWWLGLSRFPWWWGGGSYGPRLMSEVALGLVILMIPLFEGNPAGEPRRFPIFAALLALTAAVSVGIHLRGATYWPVWEWSNTPVSVDQAPGRVWDWKDPQFLRGLGK